MTLGSGILLPDAELLPLMRAIDVYVVTRPHQRAALGVIALGPGVFSQAVQLRYNLPNPLPATVWP